MLDLDPWTLLTIVALGGVTVLTRGFFFISGKPWALPQWAQRGLQYAPIAALSAVVLPEIVMSQGALVTTWQDARLFAALAGMAWYFWRPDSKLKRWVQYAPVALVLLWIGGMKFTQIEAEGIADLVQSSPLMSWLYLLFDLQTTSNLIGIYDLLALLLLGAGLQYRWLFLPGWLMCLAVFLTTQSFLLSFPGAFSANGLLTTSGQFLIKASV